MDLWDLKAYVAYSNTKNIEFNYTINAPYLNKKEFSRDGVDLIQKYLKDIYNAGVRSITSALPSLTEIIQASGYDFKIKASTLCQITNANKASFYKDLGLERIVVDESINRDFKALRRIVNAFGDKVEVIVNPICLMDCVYRMFHYNQVSGDSTVCTDEISTNYFEHRCVLQRYKKVSNLLRISWIRPEDIEYYTSIGIHYFKLQGRNLVLKGDPVRAVKAYFDKDYDGDLMDIIYMFHPLNNFKIYLDNKKLDKFLQPFYKNEQFCSRDCSVCSYCENFSKKVIDHSEAEGIIELSNTFYKEYDKFNRIIQPAAKEEEKTGGELHIDFNF
ncbi:U32 family peptidase [Paenibacillus sp. HN-1]|nr:U32 family peptidase [Paenibacillus sinensis]